jgi:hypothetical protein
VRAYRAAWRTPRGDVLPLGDVTACHAWDAAVAAYQHWPFVPVGSVTLSPRSEGPEPRRRGFHNRDVASRAGKLADHPEAHEKRRVGRAMSEARKRKHEATLTVGQRKWRDLKRRRERANPRPVV